MDLLEKIAQIGLPVVVGLVMILVLIAILDRHPRKKASRDARDSDGRETDHS